MTDRISELRASLDSFAQRRPSLWTQSACGVTRSGCEIPVILERDAYLPSARRARVLLVSGLSGRDVDVGQAMEALEIFASSGQRYAGGVALSAVPCGNPDGLALGVVADNGAGGDPSTGYPPEGNFFFDSRDPEKRYLWRWICFQAPDLVLEVQSGDRVRWEANQAARRLAPAVGAAAMRGDSSLLAALGTGTPGGLGPIPGLRLTAKFTTFLYPVVKHTALSRKKAARRHVPLPDTDPEIHAELPSDVEALLTGLSPLLREVVWMRFVDGFSLPEIAGALKVPLGTVKSRLHNALAALRKKK